MIQLLYNIIAIPLQFVLFHAMYPFHKKIRSGISGRRNLFSRLKENWSQYQDKTPRIWIHNSSLGEYEQARPLMLKFRENYPDCVILVTFFSPSGYHQVKHSDSADYITYLPFDSRRNAGRFIEIVKPDLAIVIRHDFWPNHLWALKQSGIPAVLVNCSLQDQWYFRFFCIRKLFREMIRVFDRVFFISEEVEALCKEYHLLETSHAVTGDTKYDQVVQRAKKAEKEAGALKKMKYGRKGFVVGSCWPEDEAVILPVLSRLKKEGKKIWTLLVPHEPNENTVHQLELHCHQVGLTTMKYSVFLTESLKDKTDILIVDQIGLLASLYDLGEIAYVGGGFATGLHNVLEPAALGKVVLFGPLYHRFSEAVRLVEKGVGIPIQDESSLYESMNIFFMDTQDAKLLGQKAEAFVQKNIGAAESVMNHLIQLLNKK